MHRRFRASEETKPSRLTSDGQDLGLFFTEGGSEMEVDWTASTALDVLQELISVAYNHFS